MVLGEKRVRVCDTCADSDASALDDEGRTRNLKCLHPFTNFEHESQGAENFLVHPNYAARALG